MSRFTIGPFLTLLAACAGNPQGSIAVAADCQRRPSPVGQPDTGLGRLNGPWRFSLYSFSGVDSSRFDVTLAADPYVRKELRFTHGDYDVTRGQLIGRFRPVLQHSPSSREFRLHIIGDSVSGVVGESGTYLARGDVFIVGAIRKDLIVGHWDQLGVPGCARGTFALRRLPA